MPQLDITTFFSTTFFMVSLFIFAFLLSQQYTKYVRQVLVF